MKKLLSLVFSLTICISGITALTSNAEIQSIGGWYIVVDQGIPTYLKPCDEWNEYFDLTPESSVYIYKNVNIASQARYRKSKTTLINGKDADVFSTMWGKFTDYKCISMEEAESVKAYIDEKYPDFSTLIKNFSDKFGETVYVYISGDAFEALSYEEQFEVAKNIKANTGVKASPTILATPAIEGYAAGDADMDGSVTINDAAQIMSFVTNYEKYPLSEMSQIVGDVYNTGDGINNMDALQIQRMLANLE